MDSHSLAARREQLRRLKIYGCAITSVDGVSSDGRTVVKAILQPAHRSTIHVQVWLPSDAQWNGCFLGLGNGGAAGTISIDALSDHSAEGYAVAMSDLGTSPGPDSGVQNPEVWKDFGYRATHLMTVVGKQVTKEFFGKEASYAYFLGGSTGGQQGLQEAQRYPADYDGIAAAVPAHCRTPLHAYFLWNEQILLRRPFTPEQDRSVVRAAVDYMAARELPVAAGRFLSDPRCTAEDIEAVIRLARARDSTLNDEHARALRRLFDGPRHEITGERIFRGVPLGASVLAATGNLYLFDWVFGKGVAVDGINFHSDIDEYTAKLAPYLNAENPDITAFGNRGGKLIMTVGTADPVVPYHSSVDYYERVIRQFGGVEAAQAVIRLFVIPGLSHDGGPGVNQSPDLLSAVRAWREAGDAPDGLTGTHAPDGDRVLWTLPLYPYPSLTAWDAPTAAYVPQRGQRVGDEPTSQRFFTGI